MNPPKYTYYELKMEGNVDIMAFLKEYLPATFPTIAEANVTRRAIDALFGEAVEAKLISVNRIPARTRRRVLRI